MWYKNTRLFIARHSTPVCHLCGLHIEKPISDTIWCLNCMAFFSPKPRCQRCGLTTLISVPECGSCLSNPPLWNKLYCVGDYQLPLSSYIHKLKYAGHLQNAYDLTYLLSQRIINPAPLIVSMPLHWSRFIRRGYNQSDVLGYYLTSHLNAYHVLNNDLFDEKALNNKVFDDTVFDGKMFKRIKVTPSQQGLDKQQRVKNLRHAFALNYRPEQSHVAIIDDVVTTGSSVRQLCKLLLDIGVEKIDIYCICRTGI
ncbi:ComF family protein [Vibrio sp. MA40-2]|uniref:ComF family protein n=1 Tax=Vibrio sp. MA40-2 TaxID=3391828 RepID=UPI0039A6E908